MGEAEKQARQYFEQFKALHPNSTEGFFFSLKNVRRWIWHIERAQEKAPVQDFKKIDEVGAVAAEASERAFLSFEEMPEYMRRQFALIASYFPGQQVYATGSRVDGSYMEEWSPDEVRLLREKLGKKTNKASDYDVVVEPGSANEDEAQEVQLPKGADLLRYSPGGPKIAIPMWDFSKLPKKEHARVIILYQRGSWGSLMQIHNEYRLSSLTLCCDTGPVRRWFKYAIEKGLIKAPEGETNEEDGHT